MPTRDLVFNEANQGYQVESDGLTPHCHNKEYVSQTSRLLKEEGERKKVKVALHDDFPTPNADAKPSTIQGSVDTFDCCKAQQIQ